MNIAFMSKQRSGLRMSALQFKQDRENGNESELPVLLSPFTCKNFNIFYFLASIHFTSSPIFCDSYEFITLTSKSFGSM